MSTLQTKNAVGSDPWTMRYVPFGEKEPITLSPKIVRNLIAKPTKAGAMPSDQDIYLFLMLCKVRELNPFVGDAFLVGYDSQDGPNFSLITSHQALAKRAELNPKYNGMESGLILLRDGEILEEQGDFFLDGDVILGGWAKVYLHGCDRPTYRRVRLSTYDTGRSRWKKDPAGMIVKVAEADALRSTFPSQIGGLSTEGETLRVISDVASEPPAAPQKDLDSLIRSVQPPAQSPTQAPASRPQLSEQTPIALITDDTRTKAVEMMRLCNRDWKPVLKELGVKSLDKVTEADAMQLIGRLEEEIRLRSTPGDAAE